MAIEWGAWEYSGGNGMRVGLEVTKSSVGHNSNSVTFTIKVYTENQYSYSDDQTLNYGGAISGSTNFNNGAGGSPVLRATKQDTYNYGSTEYGSSPGNRTFTATLSGAYNGVTPSKSVTEAIPARPYAAPAAPDSVDSTRNSDTQIVTTWDRNQTAGEPYDSQTIQRWDNVSAAWTTLSSSLAGTATSYTANGLSANRRYQFRVRANNSEGSSAYANGDLVQTTPAAPSGAAVAANGTSGVIVSWTNNASGTNYDYTTDLEESVNGGAYAVVANIAEGTASASRTGLSPGSVYQYRVRAKSTTGATTYSTYSTTSTIQLISAPAAPTSLSVTRNSDTSYSLSWTNNPTATAPYDSVVVERWDSVSATWGVVANLAGTATSLTDTGTVANRKYQWRVRAVNAADKSANTTSGDYFTTPGAPTSGNALASGSSQITVTWTNNVTYSEYSTKVKPFKNGVAETEQTIAGGTAQFIHTGIDPLASYYYEIKAVSTTGSLTSSTNTSNTVMAAAAPNAPTNLSPTGGVVRDLALDNDLTWTHSPSQDGSAQTKFEVQHRVSGAGSWTSSGQITDPDSVYTLADGTYANGQVIEWQVRTWGVHADPSPWSSTATITGSTTPTVSYTSPATTLTTSAINVAWTYYDAESTAQAAYEVKLFDSTGTTLIEEKSASGTATSVAMSTVAVDGASYRLTLRVQDGSGLWSNLMTRDITVDFVPPAECVLNATLDPASGVVVLTLNPTADDGGVTTLPAVSATIERQVYDPETETYGDWELIAANVEPDATIIDTTAPIHEDGHYRVTTYSATPSSYKPIAVTYPNQWETKWLYVSGGDNFDVVCRMWANIEIGWKASRQKVLHYFAGRHRPVLYSGEAKEKVLSVSGYITDDGSDSAPGQWLRLAQQPGPVLLRAPGKRRIYGALSEVSVDRIHKGLHKVSFSIQEVYR